MATSRASAGLAVPSTASAASRHCCNVTEASLAPTGVTAEAAADSEVIPNPVRMHAMSGSAAASPQTPTGLPTAAPARAVAATRAMTPGCHGSVRVARSEDIRSAAIVY